MFHIVLYQPEIPPNTGNIVRLCANANCQLHLIEPLGFTLSDKQFKRAGLDYHHLTRINVYQNYEQCRHRLSAHRWFACSTKGVVDYHQIAYQPQDVFLFGSETQGLPAIIREALSSIKIPMQSNTRSLNLANAASIMIYEAWRQHNFYSLSLS